MKTKHTDSNNNQAVYEYANEKSKILGKKCLYYMDSLML